MIQRCDECGKLRWPPSVICPECLSVNSGYTEIGQMGRIYSFVVFRRSFHPELESKIPYVVAVIDMDDGVRLVSNIVRKAPEELHCGERVRACWDNELSTPQFEVVTEE